MPAESTIRDGLRTGFQLIETLGWTPAHGFTRIDGHMARLSRSAGALGFMLDIAAARRLLDEAVADAELPRRVRLTLDRGGAIAVTTAAMTPPKPQWQVAIARTRLTSSDPLLPHKTSRRHAYDAARSEFDPAEIDEVLLVNERGELCEGTITSLFVPAAQGLLLTPALSCGLLAGVLRQELLAAGKAREATLTPADIRDCDILLGNSLRGLIPARLAE